ncbi:MAG: glycosyltransferase family 2 protein [Acidimicrobiales bacterium]
MSVRSTDQTFSVSIVIPSKDNPVYLANCIDSLTKVPSGASFEIVIVDSGSTTAPAKTLQDELKEHYLVEWVDCDQGGTFNFPELVNAGVAAARGSYVLLLNDDTEALHDGWLASMLETAERDDRRSIVGPVLVYPDLTIQHGGVALDQTHLTVHRDVGTPLARWRRGVVEPASTVWAVTGAAMLVWRDLYEDLGGFDERYAVSYNDIDFVLRARQAGVRCRLENDAVLIHFESKTRGSDARSQEKTLRHLREGLIFLQRWSEVLEADGVSCEQLRRGFMQRIRAITGVDDRSETIRS